MSVDAAKFLDLLDEREQELMQACVAADRSASTTKIYGCYEVRLWEDGTVETIFCPGGDKGKGYVVAAVFEAEGEEAMTEERYDREVTADELQEFIASKLEQCRCYLLDKIEAQEDE